MSTSTICSSVCCGRPHASSPSSFSSRTANSTLQSKYWRANAKNASSTASRSCALPSSSTAWRCVMRPARQLARAAHRPDRPAQPAAACAKGAKGGSRARPRCRVACGLTAVRAAERDHRQDAHRRGRGRESASRAPRLHAHRRTAGVQGSVRPRGARRVGRRQARGQRIVHRAQLARVLVCETLCQQAHAAAEFETVLGGEHGLDPHLGRDDAARSVRCRRVASWLSSASRSGHARAITSVSPSTRDRDDAQLAGDLARYAGEDCGSIASSSERAAAGRPKLAARYDASTFSGTRASSSSAVSSSPPSRTCRCNACSIVSSETTASRERSEVRVGMESRPRTIPYRGTAAPPSCTGGCPAAAARREVVSDGEVELTRAGTGTGTGTGAGFGGPGPGQEQEPGLGPGQGAGIGAAAGAGTGSRDREPEAEPQFEVISRASTTCSGAHRLVGAFWAAFWHDRSVGKRNVGREIAVSLAVGVLFAAGLFAYLRSSMTPPSAAPARGRRRRDRERRDYPRSRPCGQQQPCDHRRRGLDAQDPRRRARPSDSRGLPALRLRPRSSRPRDRPPPSTPRGRAAASRQRRVERDAARLPEHELRAAAGRARGHRLERGRRVQREGERLARLRARFERDALEPRHARRPSRTAAARCAAHSASASDAHAELGQHPRDVLELAALGQAEHHVQRRVGRRQRAARLRPRSAARRASTCVMPASASPRRPSKSCTRSPAASRSTRACCARAFG